MIFYWSNADLLFLEEELFSLFAENARLFGTGKPSSDRVRIIFSVCQSAAVSESFASRQRRVVGIGIGAGEG